MENLNNKGRNMFNTVKLFDSHCHLQDPRIFNMAPQLIDTALSSGIKHFAVNGVSEVVHQMNIITNILHLTDE